jgi:acetyl esterase/lipase
MKLLLKVLLPPLALLATAAACSPLASVNAVSPDHGYGVEKDIAYGPEDRQSLDVYRPDSPRSGAPVVMFFYGGSWKRGDKDGYRFVGQSLAARGYTVLIPDYRLYPEVRFPAFVEDGAAAVGWASRNLSEAESGIVLIGHSAGAHTAALLALDGSYLRAQGVPEGQVAGMIGLAGPYAFDPRPYWSYREIFAPATPPETSQPVTHARGDGPPLLLLHGGDDNLVKPINSQALQERVAGLGGDARYVEFEEVDHFEILVALSDTLDYLAPVLPEIEAFLEDRRGAADSS